MVNFENVVFLNQVILLIAVRCIESQSCNGNAYIPADTQFISASLDVSNWAVIPEHSAAIIFCYTGIIQTNMGFYGFPCNDQNNCKDCDGNEDCTEYGNKYFYSKCNGEKSCFLWAENSAMSLDGDSGDPCPDTVKTLSVFVTCISN